MKKLLIATTAALAVMSAAAPVQAATVTGGFNVTVNLTSVCTMATIGALAFTYTAFGGAATATPTNAVLTCTRGLTGVTANFNSGTDMTADPAAANAVGAGVVSGLRYDISTTNVTATGNAATTIDSGTADTRTYTIAGTMPAGQAGTCITGPGLCTGTQARTLTVTY